MSELERALMERIRQCADLAGSGNSLSQKAGIPRSTLETYLSGVAEPKALKLAAIARAVGASMDWMFAGVGDPPARDLRTEQPLAGFAAIPLYDVSARGGANGAAVVDERIVNELAFREDWIRRELRTSPQNVRLIHVEGDSMEPDLRAGDIILVDHTDTAAKREGVYVIRMDNALLVKALQRLPGGIIKVTSRNVAYEPFNVNAVDVESSDDFSIIGRVVWACRRF